MRDEFINHLDMFGRCFRLLDLAEHRPLWEDQPPVVFTTKVGNARLMVGAIQSR